MHEACRKPLRVSGERGNPLQAARIRKLEHSRTCASQAAQMRPATQRLPQFVRNRTHISPRAHTHRKRRLVALQPDNIKGLNVNDHWLEFHRLSGTSELVCGSTANLLR